MKSRSSNRHPTSDPTDDWVNGSWTVDCICGVNFDDGEEMVDCDECGVWVHTRCFRFVTGEKSFACDKCKKKLIRNSNNNTNDSEETEVAQLLVELPTKTIKMSSSNSHSNSINHNYGSCHANNVYSFGNPPPPPPSRRSPYRLWVNRPMEERVHVQGVPGGDDDPSIFQGFPIVFASELWKCTGYVPKKFNFSYKEFPCWEEEEEEEGVEGEAKEKVDSKVEAGVENVVDKGAGVLYSLSKENVVFSSMKRGQAKSGGSDRKGLKERKLDNGGDSKKVSVPSLSKKEKGSSRPILVQCSSKRSREDLGLSKDRSGKKKVKAIRQEQDSKKDKVQGVKAAVVHSSSAKQAEVHESKANKGAISVNLAEADNIEKPRRTVSNDEGNAVHRPAEVSGHGCSSEKRVKAEKPGDDAIVSVQNYVTTEIASLLIAEKDSIARNSIKKEGPVLDAMDKNQGERPDCQTSELSKSKPLAEYVDTDTLECSNNEVAKDVETTVPLTSGHCASKTKLEANVDHFDGVIRRPPDINVELESDGTELGTDQVLSPNQECEGSKLNEAVAPSSQPHEHKVQDGDKTLEAVSGSQFLKDGVTENQRNDEVKCEGSENPVKVQKIVSDSKEVTRVEEETSKQSVETLPPPGSNHKTISAGKSSPCSSTVVISRSSLSDRHRAGNSSSIGKRAPSNFSLGTKKESAPFDQVKDELKYEKTKNTLKDHSKSSTNPMSKASHPSKSVTSPTLKHHTSLGKDSLRHPFSRKSPAESASLSSSIDEPAGSLQTQHASTGHNKCTTSGGQHRHEKAVQPNLQSSSKPTQSSFGHPPPSSSTPAGLSDEELALLLHQELNSSPRVPRVPRVRHAGSLPQSSSASAASILIKRGISGGKDQHTFSRRKNKDGSRSSREQEGEARKVDRPPSSPDSAKTSDVLTQAEGQSEMIHSVRKNPDDISTAAADSGPSSTDANELKSSSTRDSPVNNPEDDTGTNKGLPLIHRTLPGLIAEIMGAGRRMTYEELCNAVLPHWQNLRKHNGERYAYSSHSQAVLDCLRNRSEWARLVDRGPKTNASRKKRKTDVEPPESEDGEDRTQRHSKSKSFESNKEEFPKGRRKARKRRRLALRGRGVRDDRKRTKVVARSEDSGSLSNSSEESGSSEDDSQGSGMCATKSEVSASSADLVAGQ